jgi:hypothetical protein
MFISIDDPEPDEEVTTSLVVSGEYACPQSPTPYINCWLVPDGGADIKPKYLNYTSGTWEAYFEGIAVGDYTTKAIIRHGRDEPGEKSTTVAFSVEDDPGVTTTTPNDGAKEPANKSFTVKGTVDMQYATGDYNVEVYGSQAGMAITDAGSVTPNPNDGTWSFPLLVPLASGNVDIHADLYTIAKPLTLVAEAVIGRITIT